MSLSKCHKLVVSREQLRIGGREEGVKTAGKVTLKSGRDIVFRHVLLRAVVGSDY